MRPNNYIKIIFSSILLCIHFAWLPNARAQQYSLADTTVVNKLLTTASDSNSTNPTKSMLLSEQAANIAQKINYTQGYVKALTSKGLSQCSIGKPDNGLSTYSSAISIAEKKGLKNLVGRIHMLMGSAYEDKGEYTKAAVQFDLSLKLTPRTDSLALSTIYSYMGIMMSHMQDYDNSIEYMQRSINSLPQHHSMEREASIVGNIAAIYIELKQYNKAFQYLYRAVSISDSLHSKESLPVAYMNLGLCHDYNNQKDSALYYYFKSLALFQETEDIHNEAILLNDIGTVYFERNKLDEAAIYYKKSLAMARKSSNLVVVEMNYNNLSRVYYQKGDYKTSADYKDAYNLCRDTLYSNESLQAIADLTTKYETQEVTQKNAVLQKENDLQKSRLREKKYIGL